MFKKSSSKPPAPPHRAARTPRSRTTSARRLVSLDCLRGGAVLAMALANAPLYLGPPARAWQSLPIGASPVDVGAQAVLAAVDNLQLYLVFAVLFGYGLGMQLQRTATTGSAYVRCRLLVLAILGALHALLLWYGDILLTYALGGAVVVALRDLRRSVRLLLALVLLVCLPLVLLVTPAPAPATELAPAQRRTVAAQLAAYRAVDLGHIVAQRLADTRRQGAANLVALPAIIALMLVGLEGARDAWPNRLAAWAQRHPIQVLLVLSGGLALTQGGTVLAADVGAAHTSRLVGAPVIGVAVLAWLLGRERSGRRIPGQRTLAAVGRLSISSYIAQSLLFTSLAYGYGWGTYGRWSPLGMLLVAVAIAATGAIVARALDTYWSVGPVEWLWRCAARAGAQVTQRGTTRVPCSPCPARLALRTPDTCTKTPMTWTTIPSTLAPLRALQEDTMTIPTPSTTDLMDELNAWPGAALVIDPRGQLFAATADARGQQGPTYHTPDQGIDVATLFDLAAAPDVQALHAALLGYAQECDPCFAAHSLPLLHAAIACGNVTGQHPLHVLARWTAMAAPQALHEARQYAPAAVRQFTGGDDPNLNDLRKFTQSAWSTLATRLCPLLPHLALLTQPDIPADWHQHRATVYVTLPLDPRTTTLVTCIVQGCLRAVQRRPAQTPVLLVLDDGMPPLELMVEFDNRTRTAASTSAIVPSLAFARMVLANAHTRLILSTNTTDPTDAGVAPRAGQT